MRRSDDTAQVPRDPDDLLALLRPEAAAVLSRALIDAGLSRRVVATLLACSETRLATYCDPEHDATLGIDRAKMLPERARMVLAQWIVGDSAVVVGIDHVTSPEAPSLAMVARTQRATSEAVASLLDGLADGHLDAVEGAALELACDRALAAIVAARLLAREAQRRRVVAMTGPGSVQ